jgi:succinyl-CoA synthetase beta subunit
MGVKVPVVVRLEGTNVEEGRKIFVNSGLNFTVADGMLDADQSRGLSKGGM